MMTKQDFVALADAIRDGRRRIDYLDKDLLAVLADFCASRNPRFQRERWLGYVRGECGPNGGKLE